MSFLYPLKVNLALAGLGVPPDAFPRDWRQEMQDWGKRSGLSPSETALVMLADTMGIGYPDNANLVVAVYIRDKKIDRNKPLVMKALRSMNMD